MGLGVGGAGKYVPPSRKGGFGNRGESDTGAALNMGEDHTKIRVTNISEDTTEGDLRDLFSAFGRINRCVGVVRLIRGAFTGHQSSRNGWRLRFQPGYLVHSCGP